MLGAIIGDIVGSVYEFNNYRAKDFKPFFHPKAFFTDDTVCTIAVADALVNDKDPAATLREWGRRYWDNGGWGQRFALWIATDDMGPYNSLGNGAAMRVSAAGLLAKSVEEATRRDSRHKRCRLGRAVECHEPIGDDGPHTDRQRIAPFHPGALPLGCNGLLQCLDGPGIPGRIGRSTDLTHPLRTTQFLELQRLVRKRHPTAALTIRT